MFLAHTHKTKSRDFFEPYFLPSLFPFPFFPIFSFVPHLIVFVSHGIFAANFPEIKDLIYGNMCLTLAGFVRILKMRYLSISVQRSLLTNTLYCVYFQEHWKRNNLYKMWGNIVYKNRAWKRGLKTWAATFYWMSQTGILIKPIIVKSVRGVRHLLPQFMQSVSAETLMCDHSNSAPRQHSFLG